MQWLKFMPFINFAVQFYIVMRIHYGYNDLKLLNPVVTLGIFDGVHRGHLLLLRKLKKRADDIKGESVVITFYPHPRKVLSTDRNSMMLLTTLQEKIELLEKCGIDHLVIVEFDRNFSNKEACDFIEEVLVGKVGAKQLIVGFNHQFGRRGEGDFNRVKQCAEGHNIKVEMVEAIVKGSVIVSSSAIRDALLTGRLEEANDMLGYNYFIEGKIVEGKKLGRKIGYPTANVSIDDKDKLIPGNGVYAAEIIIDDRKYRGVMSIGVNPTIDKNSLVRTIEVNIFRFRKEIYGSKVKVIFRFRLRDEITFNNLTELATQIEIDKKRAIELLD